MIRRILLSVSALLATAGGALSAPPPAGTMAPPHSFQAGQWIDIELGDGVVETLVVKDQRSIAGRPEASPPALLIGLHGFGMDASQMATLVDLEPGFEHLYLAPQGFHVLPDQSLAWFPITIDGDGLVVPPQAVEAFSERFARYVEAAASRFEVDEVFIIGYSQGGAASLHLAATRPELAAGFVAFAGAALPGTFEPGPQHGHTQARLFVGHGTRDALVSTESQRVTVERLRELGLEVTYREYDVPHVVSAAGRRDATAWLEQHRKSP